MAFCIHDPLVPLTGGVSGGVLPVELQNFLYPPPPTFKFYSPGVQNTVYVCGESLIAIWGGGGRGVLSPGFKKGYGRRKRRDFLPPSRRKRRDFFFVRIAGYIFSFIALLSGVRFTPKLYPNDIVTTWTAG